MDDDKLEQLWEQMQKLREEVNLLSGLRDYLPSLIASKFARDIVKQAKGDPNALATAYEDVKDWLLELFKEQGSEWLARLEGELKSEAENEASQAPELKTWQQHHPRIDPEPSKLAIVRELVKEAFGYAELCSFCFDHFRQVYENFAEGQSKDMCALKLVEYADRYGQIDKLLTLIRERNLHQYERFKLQLQDP